MQCIIFVHGKIKPICYRERMSEEFERGLAFLRDTAPVLAGSKETLWKRVGASRATFKRAVRGDSIPNAEAFMSWLETFGAKLLLPGDDPPKYEIPDTPIQREISGIKRQLQEIGSSREIIEAAVLKYLDSLGGNKHTKSSENPNPAANE